MKTNTLWIISRRILLRMRRVSEDSFREIQSTHVVFNYFFFFRNSCRLWDNGEKYCSRVGHSWQYRVCALQTHSQLQQWWHKRASILRCTYIAYLVSCSPPLAPVLRHMDLVYTVISYFLKIYSSVGIVTRPRSGRPSGQGSFRDRYKIFLSSERCTDRFWSPVSLLCTL